MTDDKLKRALECLEGPCEVASVLLRDSIPLDTPLAALLRACGICTKGIMGNPYCRVCDWALPEHRPDCALIALCEAIFSEDWS